jgi:hypothetical protein
MWLSKVTVQRVRPAIYKKRAIQEHKFFLFKFNNLDHSAVKQVSDRRNKTANLAVDYTTFGSFGSAALYCQHHV